MRKFGWLLTLAIPIIIVSCQKDATEDLAANEEIVTGAGNNAPSGYHYTLNLIGVKAGHEKPIDFTGGNGRRIFVKLDGRTKILLRKGEFDVLDANGTDGQASFQLPEPDEDNDDVTDYSVFVRGLGKPGGQAFITACTFDQQTQTEFCNTGNNIVDVTAHGNNNKFQNVTLQLLYIWADIDGDGDIDRVELFSDPLDEYYWYYDNDGLKIAQLRFYPGVGTDVPADPEPQ